MIPLKGNKDEKKGAFGLVSDYMAAGIDKYGKLLDKKGLAPNQRLPGPEDRPAPIDDREGAGMAINEMINEELGNLNEKLGNLIKDEDNNSR